MLLGFERNRLDDDGIQQSSLFKTTPGFWAFCMRYKSTESDYVDFPLSSVSHGDHYDITTLIQSKLLCRDWKITAIIGLGRTDNSTADFKHTNEILQAFSNPQTVASTVPSQTSFEFQSPPVWIHRTIFIILSRLDGFRGGGSPSPDLQLKRFPSHRLNRWTPLRSSPGFVSLQSPPKTPLQLISSQLHFHQTQRGRSPFYCALCP